jgi:hypothetical protein
MDSRGVSNVRNAGIILAVITVISLFLSLFIIISDISLILVVLLSLALRVGLLVLIFYGLKRVTNHFEEKWGIVFMVVAIVLLIFEVLSFDGSYLFGVLKIVAYVYLFIGGNQIRNLD